jgi:hypothetical protein
MRRAALALALLCGGCVTLTPEGDGGRYTRNQQATAGCKFLGDVSGLGESVDVEHRRLRNNAAKLGADLVLDTTHRGEAAVRGEAYRCEQPKP